MSAFLIWKSSNPSRLSCDIDLNVGVDNIWTITSTRPQDPSGHQVPTFTLNLNKINQDVLMRASEDNSLRVFEIRLKPTLIDHKNKNFGYQHRPRLEPLKYLIQNIQAEETQQFQQPNLGVLVNLENPYCLEGL